jgi:hypothetical protein
MMIQNFEIFPSLKDIKESLLKAFEQNLKDKMIDPNKIKFLNDLGKQK